MVWLSMIWDSSDVDIGRPTLRRMTHLDDEVLKSLELVGAAEARAKQSKVEALQAQTFAIHFLGFATKKWTQKKVIQT